MKYQIRREGNQFDHRIVMYNVYDANLFEVGTARGYKGGFDSLEAAHAYINAHRFTPPSVLIAEVEV